MPKIRTSFSTAPCVLCRYHLTSMGYASPINGDFILGHALSHPHPTECICICAYVRLFRILTIISLRQYPRWDSNPQWRSHCILSAAPIPIRVLRHFRAEYQSRTDIFGLGSQCATVIPILHISGNGPLCGFERFELSKNHFTRIILLNHFNNCCMFPSI